MEIWFACILAVTALPAFLLVVFWRWPRKSGQKWTSETDGWYVQHKRQISTGDLQILRTINGDVDTYALQFHAFFYEVLGELCRRYDVQMTAKMPLVGGAHVTGNLAKCRLVKHEIEKYGFAIMKEDIPIFRAAATV